MKILRLMDNSGMELFGNMDSMSWYRILTDAEAGESYAGTGLISFGKDCFSLSRESVQVVQEYLAQFDSP